MKLYELHTELQSDILTYLTTHPRAMGNAEAIANEWLRDEKCEHNVHQVETALNGLVDKGELHRRLGGDFYSL